MAYNKKKVEEQIQKICVKNEQDGSVKFKCPTCPYCNGTREATVKFPKTPPYEFWKTQLKSPKHVCAPMVDQSELPFRMFCRKYGTTLCYSPMFHSRLFSECADYRRKEFTTCAEDRPLVVQFCGHDADTVLAAARMVEGSCDAVDLNLGCPQGIAKKGFYGSYLMESWDVIHTILHTLSVELKIPVFAKMRVFDDLETTLLYARMLHATGIHALCVHGRTREMKGGQTGLADMSKIRAVRDIITDIPVIANGNIVTFADVQPNLETTGADAVMSAEGLLWDPRLFSNPATPIITGRVKGQRVGKDVLHAALATAEEYLDTALRYPTEWPNVKAHLFKLLYHPFEACKDFRVRLGHVSCGAKALKAAAAAAASSRNSSFVADGGNAEQPATKAGGDDAEIPSAEKPVAYVEMMSLVKDLRVAVDKYIESGGASATGSGDVHKRTRSPTTAASNAACATSSGEKGNRDNNSGGDDDDNDGEPSATKKK